MKVLQLIGCVILIVTMVVGCSLLPTIKSVEGNPNLLLNTYINATKAKNIEAFSAEILSENYAHTRRDGSIEDRDAYLQKLEELFRFNVKDMIIFEQEGSSTATQCKINVHWKMVLGYGPLNISVMNIIDRTTLYYVRENGQWRLFDDSPILKDGTVYYTGISMVKEKMLFTDVIPLNTSKIYVWATMNFSTDNLNLTHHFKVRWYSPDGELFYEALELFTPDEAFWSYWSPMDVKDNVSGNLIGQWRVEVYLDDLFKFERYFTLTK